jgi:prepilin-type N-terminal cleavage/methylation domain-containing protein
MTVKNKKSGFTLLETLVAVLILSTSIVGPLSIASRSLHNSITAKDQISAFFLAQDALEFIRFARDTNALKGDNWLTGAGSTSGGINLTPCTGANGCYLDSTLNSPTAPTACTSAVCPTINYSNTSSLFTYAAANGTTILGTQFVRQVLLTTVVANVEEKITIVVSWNDSGNNPHSVTVVENIFAWQ